MWPWLLLTNLVVKQADSSHKGFQLGSNRGECRVVCHCKFSVKGGNCGFEISFKEPFEHAAVPGLRLALVFQ